MPDPHSPTIALMRKLTQRVHLNVGDIDAIRGLPSRLLEVPVGHYIFKEGHKITECCLIVSGLAIQHSVLPNGSRQIVSFHLPGDMTICKIHSLPLRITAYKRSPR